MKLKVDWINLLLWAALLILGVLWLLSCNPVKQVLSDRQKFDEVAKEVIRQGYCVNDTTIVVKSDTLIEVDTLTLIDEKTFLEVVNDTVYITKWKTNTITKTLTIHDTIKATVVDGARVKLLQEDLLKANEERLNWKERANNYLGWLLILILSIGAYLFIKFKK
jgi:hypothetical protein